MHRKIYAEQFGNAVVLVGVYVDDCLIAGPKWAALQAFRELLGDMREAILGHSFAEFRAGFHGAYRPLLDAKES